MLRWLRLSGRIVCVAAVLALGACAQAELVSHAAKKMRPSPPQHRAGQYKIGQPYEVAGVWYYPRVDYGYRETGIASWYGPNFHGNRTANGETFDQYKMTAAHRTLPLPSMVRVTNLENGRSVVFGSTTADRSRTAASSMSRCGPPTYSVSGRRVPPRY